MTTAFITQSDYIPWRGYFDLIASADVFIILDDVQYTRSDWRNRNRIKMAGGPHWLTIPIRREKLDKRICDTHVAGQDWAPSHWSALEQAYCKAPCFREVNTWLEPLYERAAGLTLLSDINRMFLEAICEYLNICTPLRRSTDFFTLAQLDAFDKNQRVLQLCQAAKATCYISGPLATDYMDLAIFGTAGIEVKFADYSHYPPYPQLHGEFNPYVTILDTLFNTGKKARDYTVGFALR